QPEANLQTMLAKLKETAAAGATLTVFPECALTGYCFDSVAEALPFAQTLPGPATERFANACRDLDVFAVFGLLEKNGDRLFNAAALVGPSGLIGTYRKVHLPYLGIDMKTTYGDRPFRVFEVGGVKIGMLICYDAAFPEASRSLALLGADVIVLPTNWPPGAECVADFTINSRAMENAVYFMAVNRVGEERGFQFIGRSRICGPSGCTLASTESTQPTVLYADIDPQQSRNKRVTRVPGKHAIDRLADRRPEMYGVLTKPHSLPTPRDDAR
ncbi:MAG TPA: carbon-nitrogen hydrolase family protein, partial [Planctomycetaceae bacterium]|nr:carbon-nitrogen hydrolase family protein [Planctomycetaceae bacterium]